MIVVDASAVLELLLRTPRGVRLEDRLLDGRASLTAPHLVDLEVAQVLRRYASANAIDDRRGREALQDLVDLPLTRYPHDLLLGRIWGLRSHLSAYDAAYVALAETLDAPLVTCDASLGRARGHRARVEVV